MAHRFTNSCTASGIGNEMPPAAHAHIRVHILLDISSAEIHELFTVLSDAERQRAMRFRQCMDRHRFIATRAHLRQLLGVELNTDPRKIALGTGVYGKPCLVGESAFSGLRFNVSHSGGVAVIALAYGRQIGIDVEIVRSLPERDALVEQNFSRREREEYAQVPPHLQTIAFFNCWTRKEALVKAWGCGLHYPLNQFDVSLTPQQPARLHRLATLDGESCGWQLHGLAPLPDTVIAVAVQSPLLNSEPQLDLAEHITCSVVS